MANYYVNTDSGSSGNGGTDPDTDAWDSLGTAISNITLTEASNLYLAGATNDAGTFNISGVAGTYQLTLIGDVTDMLWDNSKYTIDGNNTTALQISDPLVIIKNLQLEVSGTINANDKIALDVVPTTAATIEAHSVIAKCTATTGGSYRHTGFRLFTITASSTFDCFNCLVYDFGLGPNAQTGIGIDVRNSLWTVGIYNCLAHNNNTNYNRNAGSVTCTNCIGQAPSVGTDYSGTFGGGKNKCISSDTTGTAGYQSVTLTFNNLAGDDYHLVSGDTEAIDVGDTIGTFSVDFEGTSRPQNSVWDIGPHEYIASGADHNLLADDVESNSEVSSPTIDQVHDLTASNVESNSEVSSPTLDGADHTLLAENVESPSEVSSPTIDQVHDLTANNVESTSEVSSPALDAGNPEAADEWFNGTWWNDPFWGTSWWGVTDHSAMQAEDVESSSEVSSPAIGQAHDLAPSSAESLTEVSSPAIGQAHDLVPSSAESLTEVSSPGLSEVNALTVSNVESSSEVSSPGLSEVNALTVSNVESSSEVSSPTLAVLGIDQDVTVIPGHEYQITIKGNDGATCIVSNAFTGTLTADGINRISWPNGVPKTASTTTLAISVFGILTEVLVEDVTGQANQNPSEHVSAGLSENHGTNVDSVKYFSYENNNTVDANGVVTETAGSALTTMKGVLIEEARTNECLYSADLSNAVWVASNITKSSDGVELPDGNTGTAETLTASAANGTLLQTITLASAANTYSVYLQRKTGTGNIDITLDNGVTWTTKALTGVGTWDRVDVSGVAAANPIVGVRIVTSGDAIQMWGNQLETGPNSSTYIPTTNLPVPRDVEPFSYPIANATEAEGTLYCEWIPALDKADYTTGVEPIIAMDSVVNIGVLFVSPVGHIRSNDGTTTLSYDTVYSAGDTVKIALSWSESNTSFSLTVNGTTDTDIFDGWDIDRWDDAIHILRDGHAFGTLSNLKIWNEAMTDAQRVELTT